jgi:macrolide transport system ATP-binding/permease protein
MTAFFRKLGWLTRRARKEVELREELQFHLDEEADESRSEGLTDHDAYRAARRDLGNLTLVQEDTRAAWTWTVLEQLVQDVRYAFRMLTANKTFSALAILSLALGIGANTAIFSFMDAILLRSLPVPDPQSLVTLAWHTKRPEMHGSNRHDDSYTDPAGGFVGGIFAYPAFELLQRDTSVFTTVFGYQGAGDLHLAVRGQAEIARGEYVSGNYFSGLGVSAAAGRVIGPDDDRAGAPAVAVISYGLSEARFGGPSNAPGQSVLLDNIPFTVVGVAPREFFGADPDVFPAVYVPMHTNLLLQAGNKYARAAERYTDANYDWVVPMARLRPGVSAAQAQAALGPVFSDWKAATDTKRPKADLPTLVVKESAAGLDGLRRTYSKPLYLLLGLVGLILAIACANIANLLLARASARAREMAVRLSIGAGRLRVIRQLLTESVLLSAIGGLLGIAIAFWGIRFLSLLLLNGHGDEPFALEVGVDWRVLGVVAALSVLTGILFGLAPAIQATRVDLMPALKRITTRSSGTQNVRRVSLSRVLVVSQIAFTLLILAAAGLFLRTLSNLQSIQLGFNGEQLLTFELNARRAGHGDPEIVTFYDHLLSEFAAIPGVRNVTLSDMPLLGTGASGTTVTFSGHPPKNSHVLTVGPSFFTTMQIPLLRGRELDARDRPGAPYAAVVNEEFARIFSGNEDPIGRHVMLKRACPTCDIEIVGVAANALYGDLKNTTFGTPVSTPSAPASAPPTIFLSFSQAVWGPVGEATYELRTTGNPLAPVHTVHDIVAHVDSRVPLTRVKTQRALIDASINQEIIFARLCSAFAILALTIACVGLYGTMSYSVARRTSEIGIRMALGAERRQVVWLILREVLVLAAAGVAISVPASLAASRFVESFLFAMKRNDPLALISAVAALVGASLLAGYVPARHASRIDPMITLRHE